MFLSKTADAFEAHTREQKKPARCYVYSGDDIPVEIINAIETY
jgi:hypothetical protein